MLKNYFKVAWRNVTKNLHYTLINIIGLAIGMASCFLIGLYVRYELSFENIHQQRQSIYRYIPKSSNEGELAMQTYTPAGLAPFFGEQFSEVKAWTRFGNIDEKPVLKYKDKILSPANFSLADSAFFNIFSFKLLRGNKSDVLSRPFTMVISQKIARDFFGDEDPIGKQIDFENKISFEVTGIFEDVPPNNHLQFSYLGSFVSLPLIFEKVYGYRNENLLSDMGAWNYSSYFLIPDANTKDLEKRMSEKLYEFQTKGEKLPANFVYDWLQPLNEIHFTNGVKGDTGGTGSLNYIYIFSSVAVFVLLIACFNFMNLTTALALKRAKEVGLRKSVGASRSQLIVQFIGETVALISVAFVIGLQLVELSLPFFNMLMDLELSFSLFRDKVFLVGILITGALTAFTAGAYPAFYLSSFHASKVLKGEQLGAGKSMLRKTLTIAQFGIATFMIIGTIVVFQQMKHMKNASLGFDKELVISFPTTMEVRNSFELFKERLLKHNGVQGVTISNGIPGRTLGHWLYKFPDGELDDRSINTVVMDYDYLKVIGLELAEGRSLSVDFPTDDSLSYLVNETAVKEFLLKDPLNTRLQVMDGRHGPGKIVGVVKDFHFRSLQHKVEPVVLRVDRGNSWLAAVKLSPGSPQEKVEFIRKEWSKISPDHPFDYSFLDESYDKLYKSEEKTGFLMTTFSGLAIVVACLGLLGLASFLTQQRKKEISIRKVHGASVRDVVALLSWDFIKLVLIGFLIMAPLSWYAADKWLENFAYKVNLSPATFLLSGSLLLLFAVLTVSYQSYRASLSNPAEVLKNS